MMDDAELLRRYAEDHSEDAFTELVHRRLGLVYSAALRRVGHDAQLAEDVAQKVFTDLARKAPSLTGRASLAGWLYVSSQVAAAEIVRTERRRKARETNAHTMQTLLHDSVPTPDWHHLRPVLDEVIVTLRDQEREAIALRFFEQRSFAEVGAALRLTEEAARKRVERALEKLRAVLARRGITSTTAMLTLALGELAPNAAPFGLATKIAGHALAKGTALGTGSLFASLATGVVVAAALVGGAFLVSRQHHANANLEAELARLEPEPNAIVALRSENQHLARRAREAEDLRRAAAELPVLRAAVAPPVAVSAQQAPVRVTVTVQSDGTLCWKDGLGSDGAEPVNLREFIIRLRTLQQTAPTGDAKVGIRGLSEFPALAYAIDEVRKAQIMHVVVESGAMPDPKLGFSWFGR